MSVLTPQEAKTSAECREPTPAPQSSRTTEFRLLSNPMTQNGHGVPNISRDVACADCKIGYKKVVRRCCCFDFHSAFSIHQSSSITPIRIALSQSPTQKNNPPTPIPKQTTISPPTYQPLLSDSITMAGQNMILRPEGSPRPQTDLELIRQGWKAVKGQVQKFRSSKGSSASTAADDDSSSVISYADTLVGEKPLVAQKEKALSS